MSRKAGSILAAGALTALLVLYAIVVGVRAVALIGTGELIAVVMGVAALILPVLGLWFLVREWRLALDAESMAKTLADEGDVLVDDLPRHPSGRIDRSAADEQFPDIAQRAEANPDDWRAWYHLGWAYDASGDRKRGRHALQRAAHLFHSRRSDS